MKVHTMASAAEKRFFSPTNSGLLLAATGWALVTFLVQDHAFFWDTIQLGSKQAHWFYQQSNASLILPPEIDSGHPPVFGWYLAMGWRWLGYSLAASHWLMYPFLVGISALLLAIGRYWLDRRRAYWLLIVPCCLPVFQSQAVLVSPDIVLLFGWLLGLWGILSGRRWAILVGSLIAGLISMRGMLVVLSLFAFGLLRTPGLFRRSGWFSKVLRQLLPFLPSGIVAGGFLLYHYQQTGWIGYHAASPWAPSFERILGAGEFLYNIALLGWRLLDFGLLFAWAVAGLAGWWLAKSSRWWLDPVLKEIGLLLICLALFLLPSLLIHKYLMAHRYLLPIYLALLFGSTRLLWLLEQQRKQAARILLLLLLVGLLSGNRWIYPDRIAQGWDSTLAHVPHYSLRQQIRAEIEQRGIPLDSIGTAFPEIGPLRYKDLVENDRGYTEKNLATQSYILYSNIMNDFTDYELDTLEGPNWEPVVELERGGVRYVLYRLLDI